MDTSPLYTEVRISQPDIERAVRETLAATGVAIEPELLEVLLRNHTYYRKVEGYEFGEAMRFALNASCIRKEEKRTAYASAIPRYFQPMAQAAKQRKRRKSSSKTRTSPVTRKDSKGQIRWEF
ncbi:hypothetical protein K2Q08_01370 [Patescibacteria group bacterium]|nr:hypothetical protein [Patescibacteria group bacterium]